MGRGTINGKADKNKIIPVALQPGFVNKYVGSVLNVAVQLPWTGSQDYGGIFVRNSAGNPGMPGNLPPFLVLSARCRPPPTPSIQRPRAS